MNNYMNVFCGLGGVVLTTEVLTQILNSKGKQVLSNLINLVGMLIVTSQAVIYSLKLIEVITVFNKYMK